MTNCWMGFEGRRRSRRLLRAVAATGIERIKFTTSFPRDFRPDIVDAIEENENLAIGSSAGSIRQQPVLEAMKAGHTIENTEKDRPI